MVWPKQLFVILNTYYNLQERAGELSTRQKINLVRELKHSYDIIPMHEKKDILVPDCAKYLCDEAIGVEETSDDFTFFLRYCFPSNDGFVDGTIEPAQFIVSELYDRLGESSGRFLSPVTGGAVETAHKRAIPYYIPEKDIRENPAYHVYKVNKTYPDDLDEAVLAKGTIAPAFKKNPVDGGGIQVKSSERISTLLDVQKGVLNEVPK